MMTKKSDDEIYEKATMRIKNKSRFFKHSVTYIVVNTFVITISMLFFPGNTYYIWFVGIWTVLVLLDGFNVLAGLVIDTDENVQREFIKLKRTNELLRIEEVKGPSGTEFKRLESEGDEQQLLC